MHDSNFFSITHALILNKYIYLLKIKFEVMRIMYFIITLVICFCTTTLQAENRANDLMKQAQSSL